MHLMEREEDHNSIEDKLRLEDVPWPCLQVLTYLFMEFTRGYNPHSSSILFTQRVIENEEEEFLSILFLSSPPTVYSLIKEEMKEKLRKEC